MAGALHEGSRRREMMECGGPAGGALHSSWGRCRVTKFVGSHAPPSLPQGEPCLRDGTGTYLKFNHAKCGLTRRSSNQAFSHGLSVIAAVFVSTMASRWILGKYIPQTCKSDKFLLC